MTRASTQEYNVDMPEQKQTAKKKSISVFALPGAIGFGEFDPRHTLCMQSGLTGLRGSRV